MDLSGKGDCMNEPSNADMKRCLDIRRAAKRGNYTSKEDSIFIQKIWKKYPEWYKSTERTIHADTLPFGAENRWKG